MNSYVYRIENEKGEFYWQVYEGEKFEPKKVRINFSTMDIKKFKISCVFKEEDPINARRIIIYGNSYTNDNPKNLQNVVRGKYDLEKLSCKQIGTIKENKKKPIIETDEQKEERRQIKILNKSISQKRRWEIYKLNKQNDNIHDLSYSGD